MVPMQTEWRAGRKASQGMQGFSLAEVLLAVALIGILSSIVIANDPGQWQRERANALANELAGWLEEVLSYSMRNNAQCDVQITTGTRNVGSTLASITNTAACPVRAPTFTIPAVLGQAGDQYEVASFNADSGVAQTTFTYTPRGAITATNNLQILMAVRPGGGAAVVPLRCVRITATLGLISVGRNDGASAPTAGNLCTTFDTN
jgi:prepilin-type N-terminal cleavage/methylation domain-containing protein